MKKIFNFLIIGALLLMASCQKPEHVLPTASFVTEDPLFNTLMEKSIRTLYVCMRNNFMDCPDRERGQWIGDVSVQVPQVFFVFDNEAKKLLKKAVSDFSRL